MTQTTDTDRNLGLLLHDVARLTRKRFEQTARTHELGLTRAQAAVIAHLSRHEGINQACLAQIMEIEPITLVRLLDRLEELGFVERLPDPTDRRARLLRLKPSAHAILERIRAIAAIVLEEACAGVTAEQRVVLGNILERMKGNLVTEATGDDHGPKTNSTKCNPADPDSTRSKTHG